jgi:RNA polymerase sigma-70 factor (ECF subfamily)
MDRGATQADLQLAAKAAASARVVTSDADLVARCLNHDEGAWAKLVDRFARYIYAIATRAYRLAEADAEDVFQEVFARAYDRLEELRDPGAVKPWLAQLTRRLCVDRLREQAREAPSETVDQRGQAEDEMARVEEDQRGARDSRGDDCQSDLAVPDEASD